MEFQKNEIPKKVVHISKIYFGSNKIIRIASNDKISPLSYYLNYK